MQGDRAPSGWLKKAGGEAGGPHRPRTFRRRGAYSTGRKPERAGLWPAPRKEPSAGATDAGDTLHLVNSAFRERHRDEARLSAAFHAHQHDILVVVLCRRDGVTHVTGAGDHLAGDFENDVAFLEAALGGRALRIDLGYHDAFLAGAGDAVGGSH